MSNSILRCEKCKNNKFFILRYEGDFIVECANCAERIVLEENINIKDITQIFESEDSALKWHDITI